jgi:hypothetical protein
MDPSVIKVDATGAAIVMLAWAWPLARSLRGAAGEARAAGRAHAFALAAIVALAAAMRLWVARPTLLFALSDVYPFLEKAANPWGAGGGWHNYHGVGFEVVLSGLLRVFGYDLDVIWAANATIGTLSVAVAYLFVARLTGRPRAGLLAALLLAVHVPSVRVDASEQIASASVLTALVSYVSVLEVATDASRGAAVRAGIAMAAVMQGRMEGALHVLFAILACLARRPREGAWRVPAGLPLAIATAAVGVAPRALVWASFVFGHGDTSAGISLYRLAAFPGNLLHERNTFVSVAGEIPVYPVLAVVGIAAAFLRRDLGAAVLALAASALMACFFLFEWTLDLSDALRYQANAAFLAVALAGYGAEALAGAFRRRSVRAGLVGLVAALACGTVAVAWPLLRDPHPVERSVSFFLEGSDRVPPGCLLLLQRPTDFLGRYGPGQWPPAFLAGRSGVRVAYYPDDLDSTAGEACRVAFEGLDCRVRYPDPSEGYDWDRPVFEWLDAWRLDVERRGGFQGERSECRALSDRFDLLPLATATVAPGRPVWAWLPREDVEIGFYRLGARR